MTKISLKYSDFGGSLLFGPLRDEVENLVSLSVHGPDAAEFQLSLGPQKTPASKGGPKKKGKYIKPFVRSTPAKPQPLASNPQGSVFPKGSRNKKRKKSKAPAKPIASKEP